MSVLLPGRLCGGAGAHCALPSPCTGGSLQVCDAYEAASPKGLRRAPLPLLCAAPPLRAAVSLRGGGGGGRVGAPASSICATALLLRTNLVLLPMKCTPTLFVFVLYQGLVCSEYCSLVNRGTWEIKFLPREWYKYNFELFH